jgi:cilia- and flagella-associated protein 57
MCKLVCRVLKEFGIKGCKEARFSRGGQAFAAANGTTVQLHATYTCEPLGIIRWPL